MSASSTITARASRGAQTATCFEQLSAADPSDRSRLMDQVVTLNMGVADAVASRYAARGLAIEDLRQVAYLALVKAAQGFDPGLGNDFLSYAVPTMRGEVRRHFRDLGWVVRPPRRVQELQRRVSAASSELRAARGRDATPDEIARHLEEDPADVREALAGYGAFSPASLDRTVGQGDDTVALGDLIATDDDAGTAAAEARVVLGPAVRCLGDRDRRILRLRYFDGLSQQQIADDIGVTQMQVSRLLGRIFRDLREQLGADDPTTLLA